jgi:hypothetical protein
VITESLTKKRQTLVNALYELRKNGTIMSYWSQDGRIVAKATSSSLKMQINDKCDIEKTHKIDSYWSSMVNYVEQFIVLLSFLSFVPVNRHGV